jgi:hypothetical protein
MSGKKRIQLRLEGGGFQNSDQLIPIAWYQGTPINSIMDQIKQVFQYLNLSMDLDFWTNR